jgi:hypothetical protein
MGATNNGYGMLHVYAKNKKCSSRKKAHRIAWELTYGVVPSGLYVLHHCDNHRCVRPDHLFLGTHQDNMHDMTIKKRQAKGAQIQRSKFTDADILVIRTCYAAGGISMRALARQYYVAHSTIQFIIHRKTWQHLL